MRETITLGGERRVGRIGYGAMRLTGDQLWGEYADHDGAIKLLRRAVDAGVTMIDTADVYGPHTNELLIREALHPYAEELVVATKGGFVRGGPDLSTIAAIRNPNYLRQSVRLSARRLGVDCIDLYYLHSGRAADAPFEEQVATLAELRRQGLIRHIGLSNVTVDQLSTATSIVDIVAVTAHYNLADRDQTPLLEVAASAGAVFVPWQPVSLAPPGIATNPHGSLTIRQVVQPIADRYGATIPQLSLAWLLQRSPAVLPIPATTTPEHLDDNLAAQDLVLDDHDIGTLDRLA